MSSIAQRREKVFTGLFFGAYLLGFAFVGSRPELAALAFFCSLLFAAKSVPADSPNRTTLLRQTMFIALAMSAGGLSLSWVKYGDLKESRRFTAYLAEHQCKFVGQTVTGFSKGGCDRVGNCTEGEEIEESEYVCASTGNRITFSQFREGHYGY